MSNFAATLRDLLGRATGGPLEKRNANDDLGIEYGPRWVLATPKQDPDDWVVEIRIGDEPDADLTALLWNHAEKVLAVVEAAHTALENRLIGRGFVAIRQEDKDRLHVALAQLDAGGE